MTDSTPAASAVSPERDDGPDMMANPMESLECPMCCTPFDTKQHEAKFLSCHHSFCLSCIGQLANGRHAFRCPRKDCRQKTPVPANGVVTLPTNQYVSQMRHLVTPGGGSDLLKDGAVTQTCDKHMNQPLLFFCETCMAAICMNCTVLDHDKTKGHVINDLSATVKTHRDILKAKMTEVQAAQQANTDVLSLLKRELGGLEAVQETTSNQIKETFRQLATVLEQREADLQAQVTKAYQERKQMIVAEAQNHKSHSASLQKLADSVTSLVEGNKTRDSLQAVSSVELMGKIGQMCERKPLQIKDGGFIEFEYNQGLDQFLKSVANLGHIKSNRPLPARVTMTAGNAFSGVKASVKVTVHSVQDTPIDNCPITATIVDPCGDNIPSKFRHINDDVHVVEYRPQMPKKHQISLNFLQKPIWGAAMDLVVNSNNPVLKFGHEEGPHKLFHPTSVAVAQNGNVYVADMGNKRIMVYNASGRVVQPMKVSSNKSTTYDIAINHATGELICTKVGPDETGHVKGNIIRVFSLTGEPKQQFNHPDMQKGLFLDVNSKGQIIVTDSVGNAVYMFSKEGMMLKKFGGKPGNKPGEFNFPSAVCTSKDDSIVVLDTGNHRVQVFNKMGKFLHQFGENGHKKGQFKSPRGVAADKHGHILVADSQNRIQVFKYDGTFISCIDSQGDKINEPYNLAVTEDGYVFVADFKNDCIKKYRYL